MIVKTGLIAGAIWNALNENGAMTTKELKKATKTKSEKDLYLGIGWLLREDKLNVVDEAGDLTLSLK